MGGKEPIFFRDGASLGGVHLFDLILPFEYLNFMAFIKFPIGVPNFPERIM